jgi:hypothetical protein
VTDNPRRWAGFRGKITPRELQRFGITGSGGTVDRAQGSAEEADTVDERDQESLSSGGHELASEVGERVRSIISAAEAAANAVRHEAEQTAQVRRRVAEEEGRRIVEDAKADADAFLAERVRRISELSDAVVERAETIVSRLDRAEEVRRQLQEMADALGESAEQLASEVRAVPAPDVAISPPAAAPEDSAPATPPATVSAVEPPALEPVESEPEPAPAQPVVSEAPPVEEVAEPTAAGPEVVHLTDQRRDASATDTAEAEERREPDHQLSARLVALQMAVAGGNRGEVEAHLVRTFEQADVAVILDDVFGQGTDAGKRVAWPRTGDGAA